jgi:hypothetical protein
VKSGPAGIPRLEFRIERLRASYRFSYAFHAREVRFERDTGHGFENVFPETFSFRAERHDPTELYLRLEDLWTNPRRLAPEAGRRDSEELVLRLLAALPRTLASVLDRLREDESEAALLRAAEDVAVFAQIALRFVADKQLEQHERVSHGGPSIPARAGCAPSRWCRACACSQSFARPMSKVGSASRRRRIRRTSPSSTRWRRASRGASTPP